jgi:hypothetical protein
MLTEKGGLSTSTIQFYAGYHLPFEEPNKNHPS